MIDLFEKRLTTTRVLYYMPDHPRLLQEFLWQTMDLPPEFPRVQRFLHYWQVEIQAVIHSVTLSYVGLIQPVKLKVHRVVGEC